MEQAEGYEPVNQLYTVKTRADGAASKWQVDTNDIRNFLDEKLKGLVRREVEYLEFEILDKKENMAPVTRFLAKNDQHAFQMFQLNCRARDVDIMDFKLQPTGETEYREVVAKEKNAILPADVVDTLLTPIETTFSHVGYLTKYTKEDVKNEVYRNIVAIRACLANKCLEREDIKQENLEIAINLIKNMMYQVLRASEDGWTGNRMSDITTEKIITDTSKKGLMSLG